MATLKDVAALAGVSTATVSLALNGGPVNEKTRDLVRKAARQLNYVPNKVGQMLMTGRSKTIELVILTDQDFPDIVRNTALFYYIMEGVLAVADREGYGVRFAVQSYEGSVLPQYFEEMVGGGMVDGVMIIPQFARDHNFISVLENASYPYVLLRPRRFGPGANHVDMGNVQGGGMVADLFASVGVKRVALINGPETHVDAIERERGFTSTLLDKGLVLTSKAYGDFTIASGFAAMERIIGHSMPQAVFCANDYMAAGALKCLRKHKIAVPDSVALVGYDNNDIATAMDPELTTVDNHFFKLGTALAEELLEIIGGAVNKVSRTVEPRLVLRDTHRFAGTWSPGDGAS